jgi:hypothetical protein
LKFKLLAIQVADFVSFLNRPLKLQMKNLILIFSILLLTVSCKKQSTNTCDPGLVPYKSLYSEYGCSLFVDDTNINYATFVIIKNQTDFDNTIIRNCSPNIDFDIYDLVIGRKQFASGIDSIDYAIFKNCENNRIDINATVTRLDSDDAPEIVYSCLLPKLQLNEAVNVNFIIR